jgi:hypothetical protein
MLQELQILGPAATFAAACDAAARNAYGATLADDATVMGKP